MGFSGGGSVLTAVGSSRPQMGRTERSLTWPRPLKCVACLMRHRTRILRAEPDGQAHFWKVLSHVLSQPGGRKFPMRCALSFTTSSQVLGYFCFHEFWRLLCFFGGNSKIWKRARALYLEQLFRLLPPILIARERKYSLERFMGGNGIQ